MRLPHSVDPLVVRTDFTNDAAWEALCAALRAPVTGFYAYLEYLDDRRFDGLSKDALVALVPADAHQPFLAIADARAIHGPDPALLVVDLAEEPGRAFRAVPSTLQSIQNNLSICNMDFEDFADEAEATGVFRGFSDL